MTAARSVMPLTELIGESPALRQAVALADQYAQSRLSILILGETGTGKELVAQRVHQLSCRGGDLVDVNCASLPRELVDSLLFGHRRGAFSGAVETTRGLIAQADRGTLFLDELASLPVSTQAKLLRVLETREVRRLGAEDKQRVDFRLVAAVQDDLDARIRSGAFRLDLYQRVAGVVIRLPPLRNRPEDIGLLATHFAALHGRTLGTGVDSLLGLRRWPGNVRELRTVIDRAVFRATGSELSADVLRAALDDSGDPVGAARARSKREPASGEAEHLVGVCTLARWDIDRAAAMLGVGRTTLYRRLKSHGIVLRRADPLDSDLP